MPINTFESELNTNPEPQDSGIASYTPAVEGPGSIPAPTPAAPSAPPPVVQTTTSSRAIPKEAMSRVQRAKDVALAGVMAQVQKETEAYNSEAEALRLQAAADEEAANKIAAKKAENDVILKSRFEALDRDVEELKSQKVDPERFWANRSTGDRVMAAIAIGLGGLGGGENQAAKIIQSAIDRDVDAQKANIDTQKSALNAKRTVLQDLTAKYNGDLEMASNVFKAAAKRKAADALSKVIQKRGEANSQGLINTYNNLMASAEMDMAKVQAVETSRVVQGAKPQEPLWQKLTDAEKKEVGESYGRLVFNQALQKKVMENKDLFGNVKGNLTKIKDRLGLTGRTEAEVLADLSQGIAKEARAMGGAVTESDIKFARERLVDLGNNYQQALGRIDAGIQSAGADYNAALSKVQKGYGRSLDGYQPYQDSASLDAQEKAFNRKK